MKRPAPSGRAKNGNRVATRWQRPNQPHGMGGEPAEAEADPAPTFTATDVINAIDDQEEALRGEPSLKFPAT